MTAQEAAVTILNGVGLDRKYAHENALMRNCLEIAFDAMRFDRSPATVQAMRRIQELLRENGIAAVRVS